MPPKEKPLMVFERNTCDFTSELMAWVKTSLKASRNRNELR